MAVVLVNGVDPIFISEVEFGRVFTKVVWTTGLFIGVGIGVGSSVKKCCCCCSAWYWFCKIEMGSSLISLPAALFLFMVCGEG